MKIILDDTKKNQLIQRCIVDDYKHKNYKRTVELSDEYYKFYTGDGIDTLLKQILPGQTNEQFKQFVTLTKSITPSLIGSTEIAFQKALRKPPAIDSITFESGDQKQRKEELLKSMEVYNGDQSLIDYLRTIYLVCNYIDPNAFLITEFDEFDSTVEKAKPRPFLSRSETSIDYYYENNVLQYLIVKSCNEENRDLVNYTGYFPVTDVVYYQLLEDDYLKIIEANPEATIFKTEDSKYFLVKTFKHKSEKVQAICMGYIRDPQTKLQSFVSVFHQGLAYLHKTLKTVGELDISAALIAWAKEFRYVPNCNNPDCRHGRLIDDSGDCPVCKGTGELPVHKTSQDVTTLHLPANADPNQIIDLSKLIYTHVPPVELLTWQQQYIEVFLKVNFYHSVFNPALFVQTNFTKTATEISINFDNLNDTFYPFLKHFAEVMKYSVMLIAEFTDITGLVYQFKYPEDLKLKGITELLTDLKSAKDSNASPSTIAAIEADLNDKLYTDQPEQRKKIKIKEQFYPFPGMSEQMITLIIGTNKTTQFNQVLWSNYELIWSELERENQDPYLYDLTTDLIAEKLRAKVDEYVSKIEQEKPKAPTSLASANLV